MEPNIKLLMMMVIVIHLFIYFSIFKVSFSLLFIRKIINLVIGKSNMSSYCGLVYYVLFHLIFSQSILT
jgi:hypothetical protein